MGVQPKKSSRLFILLGVVLTLLSMGGVYFIARSSSKSAGVASTQVLVASRQIPQHTVFASLADVETWLSPVTVPTGATPVGAFASAAAFQKSELASGKIATSEAIYPKEAVLPSMFTSLGARANYTSAFQLPKNDVAISFQAPTLDESAGAIATGDSVDLIASYLPKGGGSGASDDINGTVPSQTQFVLQNIKVIAVGPFTGAGSEGDASSGNTMLTFAVTRRIALLIQHLKDFSGSWMTSVVLRSAYASGTYNTIPVNGQWFFSRLRNNFAR